MPLKNPASDLVDFLHTKVAGSVTFTRGTNLFIGRLRSTDTTPSPALFCLNSGGGASSPLLGGHRTSYKSPLVQLQVRGPAGDDETGEAFARGIAELVDLASVTGYVACFLRDSQPAYLGVDGDDHGLWSLNVELQYLVSLA